MIGFKRTVKKITADAYSGDRKTTARAVVWAEIPF